MSLVQLAALAVLSAALSLVLRDAGAKGAAFVSLTGGLALLFYALSRYAAPIVAAIVMALLMMGLIWLFLWAFETDPAGAPPMPLLLMLVAIPGVVILGVLIALMQWALSKSKK